jgi:hypothetical protein
MVILVLNAFNKCSEKEFGNIIAILSSINKTEGVCIRTLVSSQETVDFRGGVNQAISKRNATLQTPQRHSRSTNSDSTTTPKILTLIFMHSIIIIFGKQNKRIKLRCLERDMISNISSLKSSSTSQQRLYYLNSSRKPADFFYSPLSHIISLRALTQASTLRQSPSYVKHVQF